MTTALLVRQPIHVGETDQAVDVVTDRYQGGSNDRPDALLTGPDVVTGSAFVARPEDGPDELVWYLEVGRGSPVSRAPRENFVASPIGDRLADHLDAPVDWTVYSHATGTLAVHAALAGRPRSIETATSGQSQLVVRGTDAERSPDVVLVRVSLRPGVPDRVVRTVVRLIQQLDDIGWAERRVEGWVQPVLEQEAMYTESIFLARTDVATDLLWYMETADFGGAVDAYQDTSNLVARISDVVLSWAFEGSEVLRQRDPETEFDPLVHAVDPGRS